MAIGEWSQDLFLEKAKKAADGPFFWDNGTKFP
jgi:hypothetical protein